MKSVASDIQAFKKSVPMAEAGQNVGILLRNVKTELIQRGMCLALPNSVTMNDTLDAQIYVLNKYEGGRSRPLTTDYIQPMYCNQWNVNACLKLAPDQGMIMPGEAGRATIYLRKPMVIEEGNRFTIRENSITTVTGLATGILPSLNERIVGFNFHHSKPMKTEGNASVLRKRRLVK